MRILYILGAGLFACAIALAPLPAAADGVLDHAKQLMAEHKAEDAYKLLLPLQSQRAGEPEYDYLLGISALDSGHAPEAVFALERVVSVQPDNKQARAEIARAYFELGETARAEAEFKDVEKMGVPGQVGETINKYLSAIREGKLGARKQFHAYLEATLGYDTNVNSATSDSQVAVPFFGGAIFTLNPAGTSKGDLYFGLAGGFSGRQPVSQHVDLVAGGSANLKENRDQGRFNTQTLGGYFGASYLAGRNRYTAAFQGENFKVDRDVFRNAYGVVLQASRQFGLASEASVYGQVTHLTYPGQSIRDANRYVGGVGYSRVFAGPYTPAVYAGVYGGAEEEVSSGVPNLGHHLVGLRLGGHLDVMPKLGLFGSVNAEFRRYGGPEPLFLKTRDEKRWDVSAGVEYTPAPKWRITPQFTYTRNVSNISIFDYDRTLVSVTLRRDFD